MYEQNTMNEEDKIIRNKYIVEEGFLGCSAAWLDEFLPEISKKRAILILSVMGQMTDSKTLR
jgi:hypothetical protein